MSLLDLNNEIMASIFDCIDSNISKGWLVENKWEPMCVMDSDINQPVYVFTLHLTVLKKSYTNRNIYRRGQIWFYYNPSNSEIYYSKNSKIKANTHIEVLAYIEHTLSTLGYKRF